ncbi:MAG: hypothetical protein JWO36_3812 [Myxococcales bacterium]|nr:hypothetical protein [Myxococcales bacterium]
MSSSVSPLFVLALAACNQVFGLAQTVEHDGGQYDAPLDAPFSCPPIGGPPPRFAPLLHQIVVQDCLSYSITSGGRAIALCVFNGSYHVAEGPRDEPLIEIPEIVGSPTTTLLTPRLSPGGDMIVVNSAGVQSSILVYSRIGGSWQPLANAPFVTTTAAFLSTFERGPTGDRLFVVTIAALEEWAYEGSTWRKLLTESVQELGVDTNTLQVATDGLRAIVPTTSSLYFTDRPDQAAKFRPAVPINDIPAFQDVFMTDDCARLYFTGLGSIFYMQHE